MIDVPENNRLAESLCAIAVSQQKKNNDGENNFAKFTQTEKCLKYSIITQLFELK